MTNVLFYSFLLSLLIGTALTPFLILGVNKIGGLDQPGLRKVHKEPVSRVGGVAFALGAIMALGFWGPISPFLVSVLLGSFIILCVGVLDDYMDLRVRFKLSGQLMAAGVVATYGQLSWQPFSIFLDQDLSQWLVGSIIMVVLVALPNAINFSDGLDGLAGGLTFLSFGVIAYLAYRITDVTVLSLALPVMGGLLGFLRFNSFPARVFMGDGGSQFLGFILGISCLLLTDSERSPFSPFLMFFIIGVPLLDMVAVTTQRILQKNSPFRADQNHLHHKLLALGFSHHQVVLMIYLLQIVMVVLAYILCWESGLVLASLYAVILLGVGSFFYCVVSGRLEPESFRRISSQVLYWRTWITSVPWLSRLSLYGLGLGVMGFLSSGLLTGSRVPKEIAYSAMGLIALFFLGRMGNSKMMLPLTRMVLYLGSTFMLYIVQGALVGTTWKIQMLFHGFFGLLVILLLVAIHIDQDRRFNPTPMDYLLLFFALVIPLLPTIQVNNLDLSAFMGRLIIVFFSCEVLLQAFSTKVHRLGYFSVLILLGLAFQAWW